MSKHTSNLANPLSTGGIGHVFEIQVQTSLALLMLSGGTVPCLPIRSIDKIKLQGRVDGFDTDDCIVFTSKQDNSDPCKLLIQIKHKISFSEKNKVCKKVLAGAWNDFQNEQLFVRNSDAIAIVTGPLSQVDVDSVRTLLERARSSEDAADFFRQIKLAKFTSESMRNKLRVIRLHIDTANGSPVADEDTWIFLRHLHLLGYDLDIESGVIQALCHSMIRFHTGDDAAGIWGRIMQKIMTTNANAGTLIRSNFSPDLVALFEKPAVQQMPESLSKHIAPSVSEAEQIAPAHFSEELTVATILGSWSDHIAGDKAILKRLAKAFDETD